MIKSQQFPNAVVFAGADGIGKRRIAEVAAAALLCENDNAPCGHCSSCKVFAAGTHPDYYYLEPDKTKANPVIKVDQIRSMQSEVILMPVISNRRIVIIDDAECMNNVAQNCLLKTIEEPQGLSKFILITSNLSRLLLTIRSRSMTINFESLTAEEIERALTAQNIDNASKIAIIANGSLGQAFKLAENDGLQIREDVIKFLETLSSLNIENIFVKGQALAALPKDYFISWTINFQKILRDILILSADVNIENEYFYNRDIKARLNKIKTNLAEAEIFKMLHESAEVQRRLRSNANLELLIESFFIRLKNSKSNDELGIMNLE
ncbi:MAG: DNA polymerase III subunit delta' [Selenomonadaceae bacterium]|nr:DNA polymerase III subunit delta' [Selenomonadaceae bacterium]MBR1859312.1 DNA polymerase III subunit delta' [Selenomonadaceae bacterium]